MRKRSVAFVIAFVGAVAIVYAQDRAKALEKQAKSQLGKVATFCGRAVTYGCRPPKTAVLSMEKPFSSGGRVEVAIFQEDREAFGIQIGPRYVLHDVCATGLVEKQDNRFVIRVTKPDDLR